MGLFSLGVIFPLAMLCVSVAAIGRIFSRRETEAHPRPPSNRRLLFYTGLGLLLGFDFLTIPVHAGFGAFYTALELPRLTVIGLGDVTVKVFIIFGLLALVLFGERRPLSSIGIKRPHLSDVALGIGAFAVGEVAMYLLSAVLPHRFSATAETRRALFTRLPLWLMLLVSLVNGIYEEMLARGFAVERLSEITRSTVAGAAIALALNLAAHIPYWGWRPTVILLPGLATFLALYLWRRSVVPCAIGHILNDAFPTLVAAFAAFAPMYLTPYLSYDRQGAIYYTKGDFDRSIQLFTKAIQRDSRDCQAFDWRGLAYLNEKNYSKSFSDFAEAIRIDPGSAAAYGDRAFAYSIQHDSRHAIADLNHAIELEPDDAKWYEMKARIELTDQEWVTATKDYSRAIHLDPSNADLYNKRAYAEYLKGDDDKAIRDYQAVVRFRPEDADAWTDLAMAFDANENYQRALEAVARALKLDPDSSYAYRERADVRGAQKQYDLAFGDLNKAIALEPDNPDSYESRAQIRILRNNDETGALADYDEELKLDPKRSGPYIERARIHALRKDNAAAIADYDSAIVLEHDDSSLYIQRGYMFYRSREYSKAMTDWKKALELKPDDGATYNDMAWLLATSPEPKARDGKKALGFALKSCELSEWKNPEAIDTLAAAYAEANDFKHAVEFENKAVALMKSAIEVKVAHARLELYEHRRPYRETPS